MYHITLMLSCYLFFASYFLFKFADNKSNYQINSFSIRFILCFIASILFIVSLNILYILF